MLFLQRGYDEDEHVEPGTGMEFSVPIWRVGKRCFTSLDLEDYLLLTHALR